MAFAALTSKEIGPGKVSREFASSLPTGWPSTRLRSGTNKVRSSPGTQAEEQAAFTSELHFWKRVMVEC